MPGSWIPLLRVWFFLQALVETTHIVSIIAAVRIVWLLAHQPHESLVVPLSYCSSIAPLDPDSDSDSLGHPTTTPLSEYAGELPDTDTSDMGARERLDEVTKALSQLLLDDYWIGGLSRLLLDGIPD
ncbi:MAG: hypothetical protein Q9195_007993 [Heterodermia aff. obscurata]